MEAGPLERVDLEDPESKARLQFVHELGFYQLLIDLAKKGKVFLTVPETFVIGFGVQQPTLICTDYESGELFIRENVTKVGIYESCSFFEELNKQKGPIPIAVHKVAASSYFHDTCRPLFTPQEATTLWNQFTAQNRPQVLQRYVTGLSKHSSLIRATWDAASSRVKKVLFKNNVPLRSSLISLKHLKSKQINGKSSEVAKATYFVLTKSENVMSAELPTSHTIDSKVLYLVSLLEKNYLNIQDLKLYNIEADFIQDEKGFW